MQLKKKFDAGKFLILAELDPPKGVDISPMNASATRVKEKVDAFIVPEMNKAVMRMSALGASMVLQNKGFETIMQVCCRDRNRIALQADLLAAYACGITNIMVVSGEDITIGDHQDAKAVYDIELIELLEGVQKLQSGRDMAGINLQGAPEFFVGSTVNSGATGISLDLEMEDMAKKIDAGVQFFVTPPIFDLDAVALFLNQVDLRKKMIFPTVLLLKSVGMARYVDRNLENVHVPKDMIHRLQKAPDKVQECIKIAAELITQLKESGFGGVLLSTVGWESKIPEILDKVGG